MVFLFNAAAPTAVFFEPVVLDAPAAAPINVLSTPVVVNSPAEAPTNTSP